MYGHAAVMLEEKPQALTVPAACLSSDDKGSFVWVAMNGTARQNRVTIGLSDGSKAEITSGLTGAEKVICNAKAALRDGQPVMADKMDVRATR